MITELFFEKIPRFFAALYRLLCESFIFGVARKVWTAVKNAFMGCFAGRLLSERPDENTLSKDSLLFRVIDGACVRIVGAFGRLIGVLTFGTCSFTGTRLLAKLRELYSFLDFEFVIGISLCAFILCPGDLWHNVYGLVIALFLLGVELVLAATKKRGYVPLRTAGAAFFAFVLSTLVSVVIAGDRADALRVMIFFGTSFIMAIVVAVDVTDARKLKKILGFIYLAVIATAVYAFAQRALGVAANASLTDLKVNADMPGRVFSTFDNPNNYAELLVLTMPLCVAYCLMIERKGVRAIALFLELLPFAAMLMTYSRSGWISLLLSALIFIFLYNKKLIPALILAALIVIPLLPSSVLARIGTIGSTKDSSNHYRLYIWEGVMRMLGVDSNWFTGVGLGPASFRAVYLPNCVEAAAPAPHSHMLYLEIWIEQGIVGVISYFGMLFSAVRRSILAMKFASREVRLALIAGVSALGGIAFASAAEYIWFYPRVMVMYFVVLGVLYACVNIARSKEN